MLEGFDEDWSPADTTGSATYTNLDPGDYLFRVRGSNSDGVWNEEGTSLHLTITPPWWGTIWFRLMVLLTTVGLVVGAIRWRVRSIQSRNRELEAEVAGKTRDLQAEIAEHEGTEARLRRTRDELTIIMAVSQDMVSTLDLNALLKVILDQLQVVVEYGGAGVLTRDGDFIVFQAYEGLALDFDIQSLRIPAQGVRPMRQAIYERRPFIIEDVWQDPVLTQEFDAAVGLNMTALFGRSHAWMGVPMAIGDEVIGLLGFVHEQPGFFHAGMLPLLQVFANQAAIAIENAQLYEQAQAAAAAEERNRLARDLHDSVSQTLFSASIIAETTPAVWRRNPDDGRRNLEKLRLMTKGALAEMRTLLFELRPDAVVQLPLSQLLATLVDSTLGRSRIPVDLVIEGDCSPPDDVKVALYRVAQEALSNVVKHAQATEATLKLICSDSAITLTVQDNGRGFDPDKIEAGHFGLAIMAERLTSIDGILAISSVPGQGTKIVATGQISQTDLRSKYDA